MKTKLVSAHTESWKALASSPQMLVRPYCAHRLGTNKGRGPSWKGTRNGRKTRCCTGEQVPGDNRPLRRTGFKTISADGGGGSTPTVCWAPGPCFTHLSSQCVLRLTRGGGRGRVDPCWVDKKDDWSSGPHSQEGGSFWVSWDLDRTRWRRHPKKEMPPAGEINRATPSSRTHPG